MEQLKGYVEKIIFRSEESSFTIFLLATNEKCYTVKGTFIDLSEKEYLKVEGYFVQEPKYGKQFISESYESIFPSDPNSLQDYLSKGIIKGIGKVRAKAIVSKFGKDAIYIMEKEPMRLTEVSGIGKRTAELIGKRMLSRGEMQEVMLQLSSFGIPSSLGYKIYNCYKEKSVVIVKENPYQLIEDIQGIGFLTADKCAHQIGVASDCSYRIESGIIHQLKERCNFGNVYYPKNLLIKETAKLLNLLEQVVTKGVDRLVRNQKLICVDGIKIYLKDQFFAEKRIAKNLKRICTCQTKRFYDSSIQLNGQLDEIQMGAIRTAATHNMIVLTGGPGVGKTTTTNLIIQYFERNRKSVLLASPTGRAAKRMKEATGKEASTVHRLLESEFEDGHIMFRKNSKNPLQGDVIIIDETSMMDVMLSDALFDAIKIGTQVILVGDKNQLPSVGPGNILSDIIASGICPVVELTKVYRQAEGSYIITNAHAILNQEQLKLSKDSKDFFFKSSDNVEEIKNMVVHYATESLPNFTGEKDVQVLAPLKGRALGTIAFNEALQNKLNPLNGREEVKGFREGDKVIQTVNNYEMERTKGHDTELGVFNGDVGRVTKIDKENEYLWVRFDDGWESCYTFDKLEDLSLAYALTIHKSQGSEYPVVVIPIYDYIPMLTTMNLIYTGVTRAKKAILLVGSRMRLSQIIQNIHTGKRYTGLQEMLVHE